MVNSREICVHMKPLEVVTLDSENLVKLTHEPKRLRYGSLQVSAEQSIFLREDDEVGENEEEVEVEMLRCQGKQSKRDVIRLRCRVHF